MQMDKLENRVEKIEHKVDLAFEKIDDVREMAQEARTLSRHASQGHVELWSEVKSIQRTQESILQNQAHFSQEVNLIRTDIQKLNDKISSNLKWSIRLFVSIILSYIGFIITVLIKGGH